MKLIILAVVLVLVAVLPAVAADPQVVGTSPATEVAQTGAPVDAVKVATPSQEVASRFDPKSLIGEWVGEWKNRGPAFSTNRGRDRAVHGGAYLLTITSVDGTTIYGYMQITNPNPSPKDDFVGTLEGNKLTFKATTRSADLVYDGTTMSGSGLGNTAHVIENLKKK